MHFDAEQHQRSTADHYLQHLLRSSGTGVAHRRTFVQVLSYLRAASPKVGYAINTLNNPGAGCRAPLEAFRRLLEGCIKFHLPSKIADPVNMKSQGTTGTRLEKSSPLALVLDVSTAQLNTVDDHGC